MGKTVRYASGRKSKALSDRSGFKVDYKDLRTEWNGLKVHKDEWEPKHPQLEPRAVVDKQLLRSPRPDTDEDVTEVRGWQRLSNVVVLHVGSVNPGVDALTTGSAVAFTAGSVTPGIDALTTGSEISFGVGDAIPTPAVDGEEVAFQVGVVQGTVSSFPEGLQTNFSSGTIVPEMEPDVGGQEISLGVGNITIYTNEDAYGLGNYGEGFYGQ